MFQCVTTCVRTYISTRKHMYIYSVLSTSNYSCEVPAAATQTHGNMINKEVERTAAPPPPPPPPSSSVAL